LIAYCFKCKEKREMKELQPVYTTKGTAGVNGTCELCGCKMFKMGRIPEHDQLPAPILPPSSTAEKGKESKKSTSKKEDEKLLVKAKSVKPTSSKRKTTKTGKPSKITKEPQKTKTAKEPQPIKHRGKLVIVESPAKARTVGKFLGSGYIVRASVGHVRDLLRSQLSVDVENNFTPKYRIPNEKRDIVKEVKKAAEHAQEIYLATDPDREGEAIAWHLLEAAEMDVSRIKRVVFHEITKQAVADAFAHPREIDMQRVNAQQARRILDRLVGYKISPLLWRKVRSRTSAGRVQSVSVRLVVEREREIEEFNSEEYWSIEALLATLPPKANSKNGDSKQFRASLNRINGEKVDLKNQTETQVILNELEKSTYMVEDVKKSERRRRPAAPFTTSTLQQEASRRLGFNTRKTMQLAQQLYEGLEFAKEGNVGLITYMRTDSTIVAQQAQEEARQFISQRYGEQLLPEKPPIYKTKSKSAQEAHEAIRPTSVFREPDKIKKFLNRDQARLYNLIWQRFVASQMENALYDTMSIVVKASVCETLPENGNLVYRLQASGSQLRFKGFLTLYEETLDEDASPDTSEGIILPDLNIGQQVYLGQLFPEQHFTQPPPRYTEATLVKTLEEYGIGRPSTYAPIISTIQQRGYVELFEKRLYPTELGGIVNELLVKYFPDIINVQFTAQMENELDRIANGEIEWVPVLNEFYTPFAKDVAYAETNMPAVSVSEEPTGEKCDKCGHPIVIKMGRFGKFEACSNFPTCRNVKPHLVKLGMACPNDKGEIVERRTKKGRVFYGCANYPECNWSSWKKPLSVLCPSCGNLLVQKSRTWAQCIHCEEQFEIKKLVGLSAEDEKSTEEQLAMA